VRALAQCWKITYRPEIAVSLDQKALKERLLEERERVLNEIAELDADLSKSFEDSSGESPYDQHMTDPAHNYRFFVKLFQGLEDRPDPVTDVHELRLSR